MKRFSIFVMLVCTIICCHCEACKKKCNDNLGKTYKQKWNDVEIFMEYTKVAVYEVPEDNEDKRKDFLVSPSVLRSPDFSDVWVRIARNPTIYVDGMQNTEGLPENGFSKFTLTQNNTVDENCGKNYITKKDDAKKLRCAPRPIFVNLISETGKVNPHTVLVKRCSGVCKDKWSCVSKNSTNKTIHVQIVPFQLKEQKPFCRKIVIEQDVRCKCACQTKCTGQQKLNKKACSCICTNMNEHEHCNKKMVKLNKHMWDDQSCSCVCRMRTTCSTSTVWDDKTCTCVRDKVKRSADSQLPEDKNNETALDYDDKTFTIP